MRALFPTGRISLLQIEIVVTVVACALALLWPVLGSAWLARIESALVKLARCKALSIAIMGIAVCGLRLTLLRVLPIPKPAVHDEFSNLLAADTFASGRLTNPTHPLWIHFESFHINQFPTYMSMYFPAQGMVLAAGKVFFGSPWPGMLIAAGLMCGAVCWMLQGWLPPGWALFGASLLAIRIALFSYWTNSYYGGLVAAIGGALVLGALPRLRKTVLIRDAMWMAAGMAILANSRPFEGLLICAPTVAVLFFDWWKRRWPVHRLLAPALLLLVTAAAMAYYNHRVFGKPTALAYTTNRNTYAVAPFFLWQSLRAAPVYNHAVMREFYTRWEADYFIGAQSLKGFLRRCARKIVTMLLFVFGFLLLPVLSVAQFLWRDRRVRYLLWTGLILCLGLGANAWLFPHYIAPFIGGVYVLLVQCMRHMRVRPVGLALVRNLAVACLLLAGVRLAARPLGIELASDFTTWYTSEIGQRRAAVQEELERTPGQHLIVVRYSPQHSVHDEWVYNAADIDHSKIVWAREMDAVHNAQLLKYFAGRRVWLVEPDADTPKPVLYPP